MRLARRRGLWAFALSTVTAVAVAACGSTSLRATPIALPSAPAPSVTTAPVPDRRPVPVRTKAPRPLAAPTSRSSTTAPPPASTSSGVGVWLLASGGTGVVGTGSKGFLQYRVEVEQATGLSAASVAGVVDSTLAGSRGWTNEGWKFQRVTLPVADVDMVVRVATPATVDRICGQYGMDTGGVVSCRAGKFVMLNLTRWNTGVPAYSGDVAGYRILVVNHEVGHRLGHSQHPPCPGAGLPQPVMMQVYYTGLQGCTKNAWPYSSTGTYIG
ncbi:MAG TPA: DUF3152 domain-containing protein [Micromonosporaceae bacterium]